MAGCSWTGWSEESLDLLDSPCGNPRVSFSLRINDKFTWVLLVGGYQILPSDSALLSDLHCVQSIGNFFPCFYYSVWCGGSAGES